MDQTTMCYVQDVAHTDDPSENDYLTLQVLSTLESTLVSLSSLFWLKSTLFWVTITAIINLLFSSVEHFTTKESNLFVRSWWKPK